MGHSGYPGLLPLFTTLPIAYDDSTGTEMRR